MIDIYDTIKSITLRLYKDEGKTSPTIIEKLNLADEITKGLERATRSDPYQLPYIENTICSDDTDPSFLEITPLDDEKYDDLSIDFEGVHEALNSLIKHMVNRHKEYIIETLTIMESPNHIPRHFLTRYAKDDKQETKPMVVLPTLFNNITLQNDQYGIPNLMTLSIRLPDNTSFSALLVSDQPFEHAEGILIEKYANKTFREITNMVKKHYEDLGMNIQIIIPSVTMSN